MVLVHGVTYRIERTAPHCYVVVRLLDDVEVGTFRTSPALRLHPQRVEDSIMRDIVKAAMRSARTSAVMNVAPELPPENNRASSPSAAPEDDSTVPPPGHAIARA
jgi:hypothetical protein